MWEGKIEAIYIDSWMVLYNSLLEFEVKFDSLGGQKQIMYMKKLKL